MSPTKLSNSGYQRILESAAQDLCSRSDTLHRLTTNDRRFAYAVPELWRLEVQAAAEHLAVAATAFSRKAALAVDDEADR